MRALGVTFHFNTWADTAVVLDENADVVIVATGGMPHTEVLAHGNQYLVSSWDIISGDVKLGAMCWCTTMRATMPACKPPSS